MKKIIFIYILAASTLMGCEDWLDVNEDPNNPTVVGPDLVLPVAQNFTAKIMLEDRGVNHLGNMMMYNWSESAGYSWYNDEFLYLVTSTFYNNVFDYTYHDALKNYADLDDLGEEYGAYKAISEIMKAYHFQILVDLYGDVPYTDALQRGLNANPAYDGAEAVYDSLIISLTKAIDLINAETSTMIPGDDDIMFGGDMDMWKQFANSIKLRILTRASDTKPATYIQAELDAIDAEGSGYIAASVGVNAGYLNEEGKQSPFWTSFGKAVNGADTQTNEATCASDFILQYLQDTGDTRLDAMFEEPAGGHQGVPQGITSDPDTQSSPQVSNIGPGLLIGATQDAVIMTEAEVYFNLAELAQKGFGGDPAALYDMGVTASFVQLGLTAADASTYLASGGENVTFADSDPMEAIITQKWLAVLGITAEQSWFDWTRTGYPEGIPVSQEEPNLQRPFKLVYPASEVSGNANNIPDQPANAQMTKVFWAAN